jgi:hypothetical protein
MKPEIIQESGSQGLDVLQMLANTSGGNVQH